MDLFALHTVSAILYIQLKQKLFPNTTEYE